MERTKIVDHWVSCYRSPEFDINPTFKFAELSKISVRSSRINHNDFDANNITMQHAQYLSKVENLLESSGNILLNMSYDEAVELIRSGDPQAVRSIEGQFAIAAIDGRKVRMARSIGRPMRYFLAKQVDGPCLIIAEKMENIRAKLIEMGLGDQFHPSYTRMVPAHYVTEVELVGCPDPNPKYQRYFAPTRNSLSTDINKIGIAYIGALRQACEAYLNRLPKTAPVGVLFSGGIDSGAVLLTLYHLMLARGESPARLKAFTLSVAGESSDANQAYQFVNACNIAMLWETINVKANDVDWKSAVHVLEDYKPLDVQSGTMALALCNGIRHLYPDWKYLVDGDGGDENLKDYPIEDNPELTIRSVLNNTMLYQEGWGVFAIKHSLTYSGGQSRGHIRTWAPAANYGFEGFSPFALPSVIEVAEGIPFIELTQWDHRKLYELKGQVVAAGIKHWCGVDMPIFEKCRFQHGSVDQHRVNKLFPADEQSYRDAFATLWA
jgi:asparagine synthase (glutamine-hydrolysing)